MLAAGAARCWVVLFDKSGVPTADAAAVAIAVTWSILPNITFFCLCVHHLAGEACNLPRTAVASAVFGHHKPGSLPISHCLIIRLAGAELQPFPSPPAMQSHESQRLRLLELPEPQLALVQVWPAVDESKSRATIILVDIG